MGQYWKLINLDRREFVTPHRLGHGAKLWEHLANHPSSGSAMIILCAAMPEARGGGDFDLGKNWHGPERTFPEHNTGPGPMPEDYEAVARRTIGRWAGDRIALIGDYALPDDLDPDDHADLPYRLAAVADPTEVARELQERADMAADGDGHYMERSAAEWAALAVKVSQVEPFTDISDDVCRVIAHELRGRFVDQPYRHFESLEKEHEYA